VRFGSLFAGIGGIDIGLERAGMECVWQVEIDDYCTRVLEKHWPDVRRYRDVRKLNGRKLKPVDLIAGGFPCQPHSVAGKRRGAADDRNLWPEFMRVVREARPRYVLAENVPGIISTYLDTVLSDLEGEGYTCWTFNIPAVAFDAPHRRERIFVVAYTSRFGWRRGNNGDEERSIRALQTEGSCSGEEQGLLAHAKTTRLEGADTEGATRSDGWVAERSQCDWWTVEPDVGRVAHGVPSRVDRLRGLGNAVIPQVAEWIGRRIIEHQSGGHDEVR